MKDEIYYNPNEKVESWTIEESELRKAFRERKEYKERINKALESINEYKKIVGEPLVGITANLINNLEFILKGDE